MRISARNIFEGTVRSIRDGAVNAEVVIQIAGGQQVVAMVTLDSVRELGLQPGRRVYAVVKASDVLVGVDHSTP